MSASVRDQSEWPGVSLEAVTSTYPTASVNTAEGPNKDAIIAAAGSAVLRHEQDGEFAFDRVWCIGHICPSDCAHVHSTPVALVDVLRHSAVGIETKTASCITSQPPARRRRWHLELGIARQPTIGCPTNRQPGVCPGSV